MIEKVERQLERWQSRVLSRGGCLVLLRPALSAIPIFYLSIFRLPKGVGRRLDGLMRKFFRKGSGSAGGGMALVQLDMVCRPTSYGSLGVLHLHTMNMALLTKWIARLMLPQEVLGTQTLRDSYSLGVDWEHPMTPVRGASSLWHGLQSMFPRVQGFFAAKLGNGFSFRFWRDDWSG